MIRTFLCMIAILWVSAAQGDVKKRLTLAADEWPPFSGAQLPNGGISLDVISTVLRRAGYQVDTKIVPWARILDGARKGDYDIVGSLFRDPAIETFMIYGAPFYETQVKFVQKQGADHEVTNLDSLQPYSIAVGGGFLYEKEFDRADHLNKVVVTTTLQGIRMVAHGRADLTLDSVEVVNYALEYEDPSIAHLVEVLPTVLATHGVHMAVRSDLTGSDEIVADFNRTLAEMRDDGSLAKLLRKHIKN